MDSEKLTVLPGGLSEELPPLERHFISAHITDTRLMGVTGLTMIFELIDNGEKEILHQFFYYDAEEFGLENYHSLLNADEGRVKYMEDKLFGGLGGRKIQLTYKEASYLVQQYAAFNSAHHIPLPDGIREYSFLLSEPAHLSEPELYILMRKQSVKITGDYELVNYFLMRTFGTDFPAATYLTTQDFDIHLFPEIKTGTYLKNTIDHTDTSGTYINESLVEFDNTYHLITTEVVLKGGLVSGFTRLSLTKISPYEAAMMMARPEFVSVYDFRETPSCFHRDSTRLTKKAMVNNHDGGVLYMMFHDNNDHVKKQTYRLNEDVFGIYYVSDSGQLISTAYTLEEIELLEENLLDSPMKDELLTVSKYEFPDSLLYEFIESGFGDFDTFIASITSEDE